MDDARNLLMAVMSIPGVSATIVMDRGGFVIDWAGEPGLDAEDMAAVASCLLESSEGICRGLGQGAVRNLICEFDKGIMLVMGGDFATRLAVLLRDPAALDAVRRYAMPFIPALQCP